jgi:hypothetical protein
MVRSLTLILCGAFFAATASADLLLTPRVVEFQGDGATFKRLEFADDGKTVTYQSPRGWECAGTATQLMLRPPNKTQAEATITRVPLAHPGNFEEESLKKLVIDSIALVPNGSENISVVSQEKNRVMIERQETFLITLSYTFYGQKYGRSILFLNRGNEQIRSQLTCHEADFDQLQSAFLRSQSTWRNL